MFIFEEVGTESMNTRNEDIMCKNQAEVLLRKAKKYYIDSINELNKKGDKLVIRGAIVIGYPGIGKSTLSKNINKCIDLDSSTFQVPMGGKESIVTLLSVLLKIITLFLFRVMIEFSNFLIPLNALFLYLYVILPSISVMNGSSS